MISTIISIFAGFMIRADDFPSFWTFVYWLDPLHYALEGLFVTQFNKDDTVITLFDGQETTAEEFVEDSFSGWDYSHRIGDAVALLIFIVVLNKTNSLVEEEQCKLFCKNRHLCSLRVQGFKVRVRNCNES